MACGCRLVDGEHDICTVCDYMMPLTDFARQADNPLFRRFWGMVPVEHAAALMYYIRGSRWQQTVHGLKYRGKRRWAEYLGRRLGVALRDSGLYGGVEVVVPVPLHWLRHMSRGYNQAECIARGVAGVLGVPVDTGTLYRRRNNPSQSRLPDEEKHSNVEDLFGVRDAGSLRGRHVLIVDDVITSGATMISCVEALLDAVDCRVSVASVAASHRKYGPKG